MSSETLPRRFWAKVDVAAAEECWRWTAALDGRGRYGKIGDGRGVTLQAHRVSYELAYGPVPAGLCVMHTCDNPPCVNPGHLSLGTQAENLADMASKGRRIHPTCPKGHPYEGGNVIRGVSGSGRPRRRCRKCKGDYMKAWRAGR